MTRVFPLRYLIHPEFHFRFGHLLGNLDIAIMSSRWAEDPQDLEEAARFKAEKKRSKAAKAQRAQEAVESTLRTANGTTNAENDEPESTSRPAKRRRLSSEAEPTQVSAKTKFYRVNAPTWQPSRSIDRFTRLNHIEEGSYGFVSRAREDATGQIVAIKRLKLDPARDAGFPVTALREVQCLAAARSHRHVVELLEVVTGEGDAKRDVSLVMEFLEHDLRTLQEEMEDPFLPSEVKTLMLQLGSATEFLHEHFILHRDLKTSNILLNNRGEIKLADFGMARFVSSDPPPPNLTQLVVTLWYRAPELLLGTKTYGEEIDIWSLGCIFGELLTKRPLLQGKNEVEQLSKVSAASSFCIPEAGKTQIPA